MPQMLTTNEFIERARTVHGRRYGYGCVAYVGNRVKVKIFCEEHGWFSQIPCNHLRGNGCPECAREAHRDRMLKITGRKQ